MVQKFEKKFIFKMSQYLKLNHVNIKLKQCHINIEFLPVIYVWSGLNSQLNYRVVHHGGTTWAVFDNCNPEN